MTRLLPTLLLLAACSEATMMNERGATDDMGIPDTSGLLRIDVYPPSSVELRDDRGGLLDLRPQTLFREAANAEDLSLVLTPAVDVGGVVEGRALTPFPHADVPTVEGPLAGAEVRFGLPGSVQQPRTTTADDGVYDVPVIPDDLSYDVVVVPDDPLLPVLTRKVPIRGDTRILDLFVDPGVPVWGRLERPDGTPVVGARVRAVSADGVAGAAAVTDDQGRYLVAVQPDQTWTLVSEGREARQDPVVRASTDLVGETGTRVDLPHGPATFGALRGTIRLPAGGLPGEDAVRVRVASTDLEGYDEVEASFTDEVGTDDGVFTVVVPTGTYRVEVAPQDPTGPAPLALDDIVVDGVVTDLGSVTLEPLLPRLGDVRDESGEAVGGATVTCTEQAFAERAWTTTTDPAGQFILNAPSVPLSCRLTPPAGRTDLALTRVDLEDPSLLDGEARWSLTMVRGSLVTGTVASRRAADLASTDTVTLASAVVEVRDASGNLLGIGITDGEGRFGVRIAR